MSETSATVTPLFPDLPPIPSLMPPDSTIVDHLFAVEFLLEDGDLRGAVAQLRAARVEAGRAHIMPTYGDGLDREWYAADDFDVDLATTRMAAGAVEAGR